MAECRQKTLSGNFSTLPKIENCKHCRVGPPTAASIVNNIPFLHQLLFNHSLSGENVHVACVSYGRKSPEESATMKITELIVDVSIPFRSRNLPHNGKTERMHPEQTTH